MSDIRDAGPRLREMNDVLQENERLRGQLAWTERERDSLRRSIKNLAEYIAELNDEIERLQSASRPQPYAKSDEKRGDPPTDRCATHPRNGALSGCETVPDPDSRVWETPCTPEPQATPTQGSVQGEGSVPCSRTENEPVAWAALQGDGEIAWIGYTPEGAADAACGRQIVPLYRHPQPTLTDEEREAISWAAEIACADDKDDFALWNAGIIHRLLERLT